MGAGPIRRFVAAVVVALGLSFAQPVITNGQLFRVGETHLIAVDNERVVSDAKPSLPPPRDHTSWSVELWRTRDVLAACDIAALARGDPAQMPISLRLRSGCLFGAGPSLVA